MVILWKLQGYSNCFLLQPSTNMPLNRHPDFLEPEVLNGLRQKFQNARGTPSFEVNNMGRWGAGLETGSYAPVLILQLPEYRQYFLDKYCAMNPVFEEYQNLTVYMHIWLPGSQINWHHDQSDTTPRLSSTIYINEAWNWNWGGLFVYDDPIEGKGWEFPHSNYMIWFQPPLWHATTMVSMAAEYPRLSVQCFFNKA